jgi:hypothetical protein
MPSAFSVSANGWICQAARTVAAVIKSATAGRATKPPSLMTRTSAAPNNRATFSRPRAGRVYGINSFREKWLAPLMVNMQFRVRTAAGMHPQNAICDMTANGKSTPIFGVKICRFDHY